MEREGDYARLIVTWTLTLYRGMRRLTFLNIGSLEDHLKNIILGYLCDRKFQN